MIAGTVPKESCPSESGRKARANTEYKESRPSVGAGGRKRSGETEPRPVLAPGHLRLGRFAHSDSKAAPTEGRDSPGRVRLAP
jgi:hypothetical protein